MTAHPSSTSGVKLDQKGQALQVFDVLFCKGRDLRRWRLTDRKPYIGIAM